MKKKKAARRIKPFDAGAYELFNNGLYRHKAIPDKKKEEKLKRKKVDIREYQPFLLRGIAQDKALLRVTRDFTVSVDRGRLFFHFRA